MKTRWVRWAGVAALALACGLGEGAAPPPKGQAAWRAARLKEAARLALESQKYFSAGKHAEAVAAWKKKIALEQEVLGDLREEVVGSLGVLARLHESQEQWREARQARAEALAIRIKLYGLKDWRVTDARLEVADLDLRARLDAAARKQLARAGGLNDEAARLYEQGKSRQALPKAEQSVEIFRKVLGGKHPRYANGLNTLGMTYLALGEHAKALPLLEQARDLRKAALGDQHPRYANSLNSLALLYRDTGQYAEALRLFAQARDTRKAALGDKHPSYGSSLNNLGMTYLALGEHAKALPLLERARDVAKATLGDKHPGYSLFLNNLAQVHLEVGEYAKALRLFAQARDLTKATLGDQHPRYADNLNNLAAVHWRRGEHAKALPLLEQARDIHKAARGKHLDHALCLNNLGQLHAETGEYAKARRLLEQARGITKATLGDQHPRYAVALNNLAHLHAKTGEHAKALPLLEQARDIRKAALSGKHPDYAASLQDLASVHVVLGDPAKARPLAEQALGIVRLHLDDTFTSLSDRERLNLLGQERHHLDSYVSLSVSPCAKAGRLYEEVLGWKGSVAARQAEERLAQDQPKLRLLVQKLRDARASLAKLAAATPGTLAQRKEWFKQVEEREKEKEKAEAELARESAAYRRFQHLRKAGAAEVVKALPADTVLMDFLAYAHFTPPAKGKTLWSEERRLLAFVLAKDRDPVPVELGAAAPIDKAVRAWREAVAAYKDPAGPAAELSKRVWQPLAKHLRGAKAVLVSPDGALAGLPFAALPGGRKGSYLLEEYTIGYLTSGRHLLELKAEGAAEGHAGLLAAGGLDYGKAPAKKPDIRLGPRSAVWDPLAATRSEADAVRRAYAEAFPKGPKPLMLTGKDADAERLKRELAPGAKAGRYRWLHLATHGFFDAPLPAPSRRSDLAALAFEAERSEYTFARNPLLASGLVLSGANADPDNGGLSAEEVTLLDLRGCELVVLSACQTGLGRVHEGEGVLGLQRGFQNAGARATAVSLWSVEDAATSVLMEEFYGRLWGKKKMSKLEALRQAQLAVLRDPGKVAKRMAELRAELVKRGVPEAELDARGIKSKSKDRPGGGKDKGGQAWPAWWAGFVLYGEGW